MQKKKKLHKALNYLIIIIPFFCTYQFQREQFKYSTLLTAFTSSMCPLPFYTSTCTYFFYLNHFVLYFFLHVFFFFFFSAILFWLNEAVSLYLRVCVLSKKCDLRDFLLFHETINLQKKRRKKFQDFFF